MVVETDDTFLRYVDCGPLPMHVLKVNYIQNEQRSRQERNSYIQCTFSFAKVVQMYVWLEKIAQNHTLNVLVTGDVDLIL